MAKVKMVWLGEPDTEGEGPRYNTWNGVRFERDKEVEIQDPHMIAKASRNPFFSVDGKVFDPNAKVSETDKAGPVIKDKTQLSEMSIAELRKLAEERGIDHSELGKAELREKLAAEPAAA